MLLIETQAQLHRDVLHMEFARRDATDDTDDGTISEFSFAQMLLVHAAVSEKRQKVLCITILFTHECVDYAEASEERFQGWPWSVIQGSL